VFDTIVTGLLIAKVPGMVYVPAFNARVDPGAALFTAAWTFVPGLITVCPNTGAMLARQVIQSR
jgi:hypothetical protein